MVQGLNISILVHVRSYSGNCVRRHSPPQQISLFRISRPFNAHSHPKLVQTFPRLLFQAMDVLRGSKAIALVPHSVCKHTLGQHLSVSEKGCRSPRARALPAHAAFAVLSNRFREDRRTYERVLRYPSGQVKTNFEPLTGTGTGTGFIFVEWQLLL